MKTHSEIIKAIKKDQGTIAVIIPFFNAKAHIEQVISTIPKYIDHIIVVDDCSPEPFRPIYDQLKNNYPVTIIENKRNLGVGGAFIVGFKKALELDANYIIKMDSDGQMDPSYIPSLLWPLIEKKAEYTKGNRFWDFEALERMPAIRRTGNLILSFLAKAATGYWDNFDPTNGYFATRTNIFKRINLKNLSNRYFFEISILCELYFVRARIANIPMPAIYGEEKSNMIIHKIILEFPKKLFYRYLRRILLSYFIYDFNVGSLYIVSSIFSLLFSSIYGGYNWLHYALQATPAPTGTIMFAVIALILGFQFALQFINYDIENGPKTHDKN